MKKLCQCRTLYSLSLLLFSWCTASKRVIIQKPGFNCPSVKQPYGIQSLRIRMPRFFFPMHQCITLPGVYGILAWQVPEVDTFVDIQWVKQVYIHSDIRMLLLLFYVIYLSFQDVSLSSLPKSMSQTFSRLALRWTTRETPRDVANVAETTGPTGNSPKAPTVQRYSFLPFSRFNQCPPVSKTGQLSWHKHYEFHATLRNLLLNFLKSSLKTLESTPKPSFNDWFSNKGSFWVISQNPVTGTFQLRFWTQNLLLQGCLLPFQCRDLSTRWQ